MRIQGYVLLLVAFLCPQLSYADAFLLPGVVTKGELVKPFPQPYIVQQGDTLWDIADEYFADPEKWLQIWEQNLQVSNPDLIYPGNALWVKLRNGSAAVQIVRLQPKVIYKPAERSEAILDKSLLLTALERQDFIQQEPLLGEGSILDSGDERLNYGRHDHVYITLKSEAKVGTIFNVFRTEDAIYEPTTDAARGERVGYLIHHLGQVEIQSVKGDIYRAVIVKAFEEIGRMDQLQRAFPQNRQLKPHDFRHTVQGQVVYIRDGVFEAGQGQVIGVNLGSQDGLKAGSMLGLYRAGRDVISQAAAGGSWELPEEKMGEVMVLSSEPAASMVLIMRSVLAIHIGDRVRALSGD